MMHVHSASAYEVIAPTHDTVFYALPTRNIYTCMYAFFPIRTYVVCYSIAHGCNIVVTLSRTLCSIPVVVSGFTGYM
jgi:hypothetical protein